MSSEFKVGDVIHDILNPDRGGCVFKCGIRRYLVLDHYGKELAISVSKAAPGSPRLTPEPLSEANCPPGMALLVFCCNCAGCGMELLGKKNHSSVYAMFPQRERVADRYQDRPYCHTCLSKIASEMEDFNEGDDPLG